MPARDAIRAGRGYTSAAKWGYPRTSKWRKCVDMPKPPRQLRHDALRIWNAGLEAVRSERLVCQRSASKGRTFGRRSAIRLDRIGRIVVVGAGKASAGMAVAVEDALGPRLLAEKHVTGWVNVPADCIRRPSVSSCTARDRRASTSPQPPPPRAAERSSGWPARSAPRISASR